MERVFRRYIGIDYSGAVTPESSCKGLRVYVAEGSGDPEPVEPPASPRRYWTRRGLAAEYNQIRPCHKPTLAWRTRYAATQTVKSSHRAVGEDVKYRPLPAGVLELLAK